jgi:signal transduction histidine kinase
MSFANTITLLFNGLTIALALGFLLIVLSQDTRKELNQLFASLLFLVTLWNVGSLLALAFSLVDPTFSFLSLAINMMEIGFTGASIAVYSLTAVLVGVHTKRFRGLAFLSLFIVLSYQILLVVSQSPLPFEPLGEGFYKYRFQPIAAIFYLMFDGTAFYLIWRHRRKIQSFSLFWGLNLFVVGQSLGFLNPELGIVSLSINLCSIATLVISFAILRQEIIIPLSERITQVEAVHKVSLAITSQIGIDTVLNQIATQAVNWLNADGAGIFLNRGEEIELVTVFNLPQEYLHVRIPLGQGIAGTVAETRQTIHLENYDRDWKRVVDLPLARETFGSVISIPLIYGDATIGVLMVIASKQGRLFQKEDANLLELLGSQAAVAVAHSHFFAEQNELTKQVEAARSQLEAVLTSTENPVIAVDRKLKIIFANEASKVLFKELPIKEVIDKALSQEKPPTKYKDIARELHRKRSFTREIETDHKIYLCHITQLGRPKTKGWVAILNDITQLKELDRMKSEMIRMTSHDLKNPLQAAMANLELVTDDLQEYQNPEVQKSLETVNKQLLRMNRIISGILDLERLKTIRPNIDSCSPAEILNNILEDLETLAKDQNISLAITIEDNIPNFLADPDQIKQALINLVENAIKFTPKGGRVTIKAKKHFNNIIFEIQDTGIGIPKHLQIQIFDRFLRGGQKGQSGAEHISGSGLGLSLVKTVIENHQGQIWLTSIVGEGTTFFVSLPTNIENTEKKVQ